MYSSAEPREPSVVIGPALLCSALLRDCLLLQRVEQLTPPPRRSNAEAEIAGSADLSRAETSPRLLPSALYAPVSAQEYDDARRRVIAEAAVVTKIDLMAEGRRSKAGLPPYSPLTRE